MDLATHVVNQVLWLCLARPHCCPQLHPPCPCRLLDQQRSSVELKRWKLCCNTTQPIQHSWRSFLSSCSHVNGVDTGFVAPPGRSSRGVSNQTPHSTTTTLRLSNTGGSLSLHLRQRLPRRARAPRCVPRADHSQVPYSRVVQSPDTPRPAGLSSLAPPTRVALLQPVWPSARSLWPHPCSIRCGGDPLEPRVCCGVSCGPRVSRSEGRTRLGADSSCCTGPRRKSVNSHM